MAETTSGAMNTVRRCYEDYGRRAKELEAVGEKLIGYICSLVPLEFITASGCIPFRMRGDITAPVSIGYRLMETIVCPFVRSCFDVSLSGRYDFLAGMVIPHACDSMTRSYSTWRYSLPFEYFYFVNIPSVVDAAAIEFFEDILNGFRRSLEKFTNRRISDDDLDMAIQQHNDNRRKVRALYELRRSNPPLISGEELTQILTVCAGLPVAESGPLLDAVLTEIEGRTQYPDKAGPRIMVDGACHDNTELLKIIEELGANVVADTFCNGSRDHWPLTDPGDDPIGALARRYLDKINCPKTYRPNSGKSFAQDAANRFGDIGFFAEAFKVDAAILYVYKYCDPFGFEVPARKAYYESRNIPLLCIEDDYSAGTAGQLSNRIQAFLEMVG